MDRALICFTRLPVPGHTKTRLMPAFTGRQCAALHTAFLRDLSHTFSQVAADLYVAYAPAGDPAPLRAIFPGARGMFPQEGEGLGQRMARALDRVLSLSYGSCVLVGADLPTLSPAHLAGAFSALEGADVTLGPTPDGGYYLVGLKAPCPALFTGQRYGTGSVYADAQRALALAGRSFAHAPPCDDVDTPEDVGALWREIRGTGSHTADYLATIFSQEDSHVP